MSVEEFLKLMKFPTEWISLGMLPDQEHMKKLVSMYEPGHEDASEHDRNGCFHYWLKRAPSEERLVKLGKLASVEPDALMAKDICEHIRSAENYTSNVEETIKNL